MKEILIFPNLIYMFLLQEDQFNFTALQTFDINFEQKFWEHAAFILSSKVQTLLLLLFKPWFY